MTGSIHKTVLLKEAIEGLDLPEKPKVIDCTFGGGGHSLKICQDYRGAKIIALDQDANVWRVAESKFQNLDCQISFQNLNFRDLDQLKEKVDAVLFDLGLSSDQLESSGRGFSFQKNEPLLMTMKEHPGLEDLTAEEIVNHWEEKNLADVIYGYGEEKFSRQIARAIVEARKEKPIKTTEELSEIIKKAVPAFYRNGRIHPATKTFQALRITVNDELGSLERGLMKGFNLLQKDGRMAVITFHSLEDRIVKNFFREKAKRGEAKLINKKPILPKREEIKENGRARSAKLRILSRL